MSASKRDLVGMLRGVHKRMRSIEQRPWRWVPIAREISPVDPDDRREYAQLTERLRQLTHKLHALQLQRDRAPARKAGGLTHRMRLP